MDEEAAVTHVKRAITEWRWQRLFADSVDGRIALDDLVRRGCDQWRLVLCMALLRGGVTGQCPGPVNDAVAIWLDLPGQLRRVAKELGAPCHLRLADLIERDIERRSGPPIAARTFQNPREFRTVLPAVIIHIVREATGDWNDVSVSALVDAATQKPRSVGAHAAQRRRGWRFDIYAMMMETGFMQPEEQAIRQSLTRHKGDPDLAVAELLGALPLHVWG